MIPRNRAKVSVDWDIDSAKRAVGADILFTGPQRYAGDASNQQPLLPGLFDRLAQRRLQGDRQTRGVRRIDNLLDRRYYVYGTYFDTSQLFQAFNNPQSVIPAQPLSVYGGVRLTF